MRSTWHSPFPGLTWRTILRDHERRQRDLVHRTIVRIRRTPHEERPPGQADKHDSRLPVAVLGVALGIRPEALEVDEEEDVRPGGPEDDGEEEQEGCA